MGMDNIQVNFEELGATGQSLKSQSGQIADHIGQLRKKIEELETIWEGGAGGDFQNAKNRWMTAANDLERTLEQIAKTVDAVHENYVATEGANQKRFAQ